MVFMPPLFCIRKAVIWGIKVKILLAKLKPQKSFKNGLFFLNPPGFDGFAA
jgi:hypothetical protein